MLRVEKFNKYQAGKVRKMKGLIEMPMAQDRRDYPATIRKRLTERWAQRRLGKIDHERRVCEIASTLIDLTQGFHRLETYERRLLELASIVHDIGRKVDVKDHPLIGSKMILADDWLPLNESERRAVGYLTRYHRGAVPEVGFDEILTASENRRRMRLVLALLRAADALDGRQLHAAACVCNARQEAVSDRLSRRGHAQGAALFQAAQEIPIARRAAWSEGGYRDSSRPHSANRLVSCSPSGRR